VVQEVRSKLISSPQRASAAALPKRTDGRAGGNSDDQTKPQPGEQRSRRIRIKQYLFCHPEEGEEVKATGKRAEAMVWFSERRIFSLMRSSP